MRHHRDERTGGNDDGVEGTESRGRGDGDAGGRGGGIGDWGVIEDRGWKMSGKRGGRGRG